jgi:hypothetical protein
MVDISSKALTLEEFLKCLLCSCVRTRRVQGSKTPSESKIQALKVRRGLNPRLTFSPRKRVSTNPTLLKSRE